MVGENGRQAFGIVAPVAVQLAAHAEPVDQLHAGARHARPGCMAHGFIERARRVGHGEYLVTGFDGGKRWESHTNIGHHSGDQQLLPSRRLHGLHEVFIVPGVDLARTGNERRVLGEAA